MRLIAKLFWLSVFFLPLACGEGNTASQLVKAPDLEMAGQAKCAITASHTHPLIVEWPSSDRLELETKMRHGLVAVRYADCTMDVLERCDVAGAYKYLAGTRKRDEVVMHNADDLYANLPVGAAKLEGTLSRSGMLTVSMDLIGRYEAEKSVVRADDLAGDCAGATHFIYGVTVGAFDFYAGGAAKVGATAGFAGVGAGGASTADRQTLASDGDLQVCAKASTADKAPPDECGALIRLEVVPLSAPISPFAGDWTCSTTATVTYDAPMGKPPQTLTTPTSETIRDNGDGTFTATSRDAAGECAKKYAVSGNTAMLVGPQTCQVAGFTMTVEHAHMSVTAGTLTIAADGRIGGQPVTTQTAASCTRRPP